GLWTTDVPVPPLPWIAHPTLGHLTGFAFDDDLTPMDQATVTLRRRRDAQHNRHVAGEWSTVVDGNGFYGFPNIKPGSYDVRIDWHGRHFVESDVIVKPGRVA